jgi:hypothetical protein
VISLILVSSRNAGTLKLSGDFMKQIQRRLLEALNEFNVENPEYYIERGHLANKLQIDDKTLEKTVLDLHKEKYVDMGKAIGITFDSVKITDKGINLIENHEFNIQDGQSVVISENVNRDIENSFNEIYNAIESLNLENKNEIRQKVNIIHEELKKDRISRSKIKSSVEWLKINASWTIFPLAQIILKSYGLNL